MERWHRLNEKPNAAENYYLPSDLKARIGEFVDYYNTERYHESLNNLTPEDEYTGRGQTVLNRRRRIKAENAGLSDVGYTTNRWLHDHEPDELKKSSLKSEPSKSGIH